MADWLSISTLEPAAGTYAIARIQQIQDLRERYREPFQTAWAAARLRQAVDSLFARPALAARQIEESLEAAHNTAQQYVRQLEEGGVLREITGQVRDCIYQVDAVLEAIEAPLGQTDQGRSG